MTLLWIKYLTVVECWAYRNTNECLVCLFLCVWLFGRRCLVLKQISFFERHNLSASLCVAVPVFPEIDLLICFSYLRLCNVLLFWVYNCTITHISMHMKSQSFPLFTLFLAHYLKLFVTWNKLMIWIIWQYLNSLGPFQCKPLLLSVESIFPVHNLQMSLCFAMCLSWIMQATGWISVNLGRQIGNGPRKNQFKFGAGSGIWIGGDCWRYVLWIKFCLSLVPVLAWKWLNENQMVQVWLWNTRNAFATRGRYRLIYFPKWCVYDSCPL